MEASKCPIGMLWFVLSIPVYRLKTDKSHRPRRKASPGGLAGMGYIEDRPGGRITLPYQDIFPCHIRPPPKAPGSQ